MRSDPIFTVGQKVVSFRGELATVVKYQESGDPSKSNRVTVQFDGEDKPDPRAFYASVFEEV